MKYLIAAMLLTLSGAAMAQATVVTPSASGWMVTPGFLVTSPSGEKWACGLADYDPARGITPEEILLDCISWSDADVGQYLGSRDGTLSEVE